MPQEAMKAKASLDNKAWNKSVDSMKKKTTVFKRAAMVSFKKVMKTAKSMGKGVKQASSTATKGLKSIGKLGVAGVTAAGVAIGALIKKSANAGDAMDKMSKRTGLTTEFLSKMKYTATLSGTSIDVLEKGVKKLQMSASDAKDGLKTYTREFDKLGISVTDQKGNLKSTEKLFMEVTGALAGMENHTEKAAIASKLFGRAGTQMLPILSDGQKGMHAMMKEAETLGYVWSKQTAKSAADLNDNLTRVWTIVGGLADRIAVDLFPYVNRATEGMVAWYGANKQFIQGKITEYMKSFGHWVRSSYASIKAWYQDGGFILFWERAKLAIMGVKIAIQGMKSAVGYVVAGIAKVAEYKAKAQYAATGDLKHAFDAEAWGKTYKTYSATATRGSRKSVDEYKAQAGRVARMEQSYRAAAAQRQASASVNVTVNNGAVGEMTPSQVKMVTEALQKAVRRGKVRKQLSQYGNEAWAQVALGG